MSCYSLQQTLLPSRPDRSGAVNSLVFLDDGNLLASGGNDQTLRIWDVHSGKCRQELKDPHWGQITCLSLMREISGQSPNLDLFVGTGRGVVSIYPWNQRTHEFVKQTGRLTTVFKLDEPVEAQDIDPIRCKFAVASMQGQIKLYAIEDRTSLVPVWTFMMQSAVPRSILFIGDTNEKLAIHSLKPGPILYLNSTTGVVIQPSHELLGGVGTVAISADRRMKVVHNIRTDKFDLYGAGSLNPVSLQVSSSPGKIKGAAFGEGGKVLVCGGDDGFVHIFDAMQGVERQTWISSDCSTVYALTTCTTKEYHIIAGGGSDLGAAIYILKKPTEYKDAIDRSEAIERAATAAKDLQRAKERADAAGEATKARAAKASQDAEVAALAHRCDDDDNQNTMMFSALACFWAIAALAFIKM
ncbi:WD40-repeat-containing domain protein [Mycena filopes]|nr:WD40-repeat-containing domain protein [Mycena filopes]